ncbi:MAG: hypothetical protein DI626_01670 [Micavibrio aeruginosavorus]|uniref:Uncharacterized protein n=1 Tax=Micavibrio aeruginosavorus TaxID=349221 RepID=A0A2W5A1S7_9BACT|nr:MAG: hypothetical protein DI626_01670 [Micavibrio aeruginosavorus]
MNKESGNALWLILIAIFLLGGLTVLLSRTGSQTEDTGNAEQMQIVASNILGYAASIEQGIQTLLMRGCSENEISFWYDSNKDGTENSSDDYYNPNAPSDRTCHIFSTTGAGLNYQDMGAKIGVANQMLFGTATVGRAIKGIGNDNKTDLYLHIGTSGGTKAAMEPFCKTVNRMGGIPTAPFPSTTIIQSVAAGQKFVGTFFNSSVSVFDMSSWRKKSKYFCYEHNATTYFFSYVILAR